MTWSVLLLLASLMVSEGTNITEEMQVLEQTGSSWEGRFCYHLPTPVLGFELSIHFSTPVKQIQQYDGTWLSPISTSNCSSDWRLVSKDTTGVHGAVLYCLKMTGLKCDPQASLAGEGTFIDLTSDSMQSPDVPSVDGVTNMKYNYAEVLQKSILFYEAQRSGKLPADNRIPWRGDSALDDRGINGEDLTGGWYDAGDNIKFNFPMASSTTLLCWSLLEFQEAYDKAGQLDHMYDSIRWPLEYFVKCHTSPNELYVQVGNSVADHNHWMRPEDMTYNRPAYKVDTQHPGTDIAMEVAAAMACGSMAFRTKDPDFSDTLLRHAKALYSFGQNYSGLYHTALPPSEALYKSYGNEDEKHWGAAWLYKATREDQYLQDAQTNYSHASGWGFSWDEKTPGNHILLYELTEEAKYETDIELYMDLWSSAGGMHYTPKCLAFRTKWGSLRYSANTALIALMAAKKGIYPEKYRQWAMCQIHYALGDAGHSFVVGFGTNPPTHYHHRGSSCPMYPAPCGFEAFNSPAPNPHTLYGALVGGPDQNGHYRDVRTDYVHNEVACDYNAGFQAAVAGLLQLAIDNQLPDPDQCGTC